MSFPAVSAADRSPYILAYEHATLQQIQAALPALSVQHRMALVHLFTTSNHELKHFHDTFGTPFGYSYFSARLRLLSTYAIKRFFGVDTKQRVYMCSRCIEIARNHQEFNHKLVIAGVKIPKSPVENSPLWN